MIGMAKGMTRYQCILLAPYRAVPLLRRVKAGKPISLAMLLIHYEVSMATKETLCNKRIVVHGWSIYHDDALFIDWGYG